VQNAVEAEHVDQHAAGGELLTAHRVASTGHGDGLTALAGASDQAAQLRHRTRLLDATHGGVVET
jgi:hypothetical protein